MISAAALATVPFMMVLGNSMLIPVLPAMKAKLDISQFQTGLMITAFSIPAAAAIIFAGLLSDRIGRKKVIVPALFVYGLGGLLAGLAAITIANPYPYVLGARILQGIGAAGTAPVAMALASDIFTSNERSKAMGILEASNGLGKFISPIAGAALGLIAWTAPFFVYGVLAIPAALAVWFLVKEPKGNGQKLSITQCFTKLWAACKSKLASLLGAFLAGTVVLFNLFGILFYLSDVFEKRYRIDGIPKGLRLAGPVLAMSITSYLTGLYLQKNKKALKIFIAAGMFTITAALTAAAFVKNFNFLYSMIVVVGIGNGLVLPGLNLMVTSSVDQEDRGLVTSFYGAVRFIGVALGPPAFGFAMRYGTTAMLLSAAGLAGLSAIIAVIFIDMKKVMEKPGSQSKQAADDDAANEDSDLPKGEPVALFLGSDWF